MTGPIISKNPETPVPAPAVHPATQAVLDAGALDGRVHEPGSTQLTRIFAALRRFAWLIALVTGLGTAASVLATRFIDPVYQVSANLYLQNVTPSQTGPIQAPEVVSSYNWVELGRTFAVLDAVIQRLRLYLHAGKGTPEGLFEGFALAPRHTPGTYQLTVDEKGQRYSLKLRGGVELASGSVTDSVGRAAGFLWKPGPEKLTKNLKASFTVLTPRDAAAALRQDLKVGLSSERGNFLSMSLQGTNPERLAETINAVQERFVEVAADLKKAKLRELSKVLEEQLHQQADKLQGAESALESFKVATVTQPREEVAIAAGLQMTSNPAYTQYFQQRVSLETIRNDRRAIDDVLTRLAAGETTVDAFLTIPAVRGTSDLGKVLQELSTAQADLRAAQNTYTDEHGVVKALNERIATIQQTTIPSYARALIRQLLIQERDLDSRIAAAGRELRNIPIRSITEARLQRELQTAKDLFLNLQQRFEANKLAELSAIPDVSILDQAHPPTRPIGNEAPRIILMGLFASLGAGLALAVLLDRIDKRFRYPEQSTELGLTILGAIPAIPRPRNGKRIDTDEMQQVIEAFRSVRLNLAHSYEPDSPICLTVTSPSPGDGKSLIAANLALSFAEAGYRTMLMDGDIRRGDLHRTFGAERRPGLIDYLSSSRLPLERAYRPTSHQRLTLLPCGTRLQHGPELLGSARMAELVTHLRTQYEVIVIDSPPLGAGIDPFVLSTHSANTMIVLRSGETDRQMAEVKLRVLGRLPVRILGAVLNHIHAGHGPYKYYAYSYGYAAEDEITEEVPALPGTGAASEGQAT
ncbi:MAG: GumC family protein [Gemmatimonadales bacterium]